ncbi:MAG: 4-alpha-glucanotransferase [Acidobacteriia bacterium]|nr:4-alpha-glucanotransferase [Terriglobia bacterium]
MPQERYEELLDRAANSCGIDPGYWDIWGKHHDVSAEVKQALLEAKGVRARSIEDLEQSLAERARREWMRLLPPSIVISETEPQTLEINFPVETLGDQGVLTVRLETGDASEFEVPPRELPQTAEIQLDGRSYVRKQLTLPRLPTGYHDVSLTIGGLIATTRYIVTPERAWTPPHLGSDGRAAGLYLSLYGLRSDRNWGCGDFRDLETIVTWAAEELKASFVGLNPLHAIHNRRPFNTSPYLPNCMFYQNFIYLDVEGMEDYGRSRRAQVCRERPEIKNEMEQLRSAAFVEYERVAALKLRFLKLLFAQFLRDRRSDSGRSEEFEAYLRGEGELLERFATYCALDEYIHKRNPDVWLWTEWPAGYQDPGSAEVREFRSKHWRSVLFYQYVEWQIDKQLRRVQEHARNCAMPIGLYHDLALATDRFGSDVWAHRPFYIMGCRVGSPPDDFSPSGQDWGFPPPDSEHHRANGYRLFAESIRKNCRHGGALRIDHVMRLFRLYWIPEGKSAVEGAYVREASLDYLRVLLLESVRNQVVVIGEDLGTVEPEVRETLERSGVLSYRLLYFERDRQGQFIPYDQYVKQALVSSTTHDLPTLAGFWTGNDIEARRRAGVLDDAAYQEQVKSRAAEKQKVLDLLFQSGLLSPSLPRSAESYGELTGDLHNAIVGFLALTPSELWAINEEDLTKEAAQQNLPGTTWQYSNWGRKTKFTVEQLRSDSQALAFTAMVRDWVGRSGRTNRTAMASH